MAAHATLRPADSAAVGPLPGGIAAPRSARRALTFGLRLAVSAALIAWLLHGVSVSEVVSGIGGASAVLLGAALALNFVGYVISVTRWRALLAAQGVAARFGFLLKSYVVAVFFNNLLPSTIGGDTLRAYDSWRLGGDRAGAVTVIVVDRFTGMAALMLCALAAAAIGSTRLGVPGLAALVSALALGILAAAWLLLLPPAAAVQLSARARGRLPAPLRHVLERLAASLAVFRGRRDVLALALALSLVLQLNVVLHAWVIGRALDLDLSFLQFLLIVPPALAVMALPVSINAIGLREGAFTVLLGVYGVARPDALAYAWTAWLLLLVQGVVGGAVYALRR